MKKLLLALSILVAVLAVACKNSCLGNKCENEGECVDGECICPTGYFGDECEEYDPCRNISCLNGGTCADGKCQCPTGYTGINCQYEVRSNLVGRYIGYDNCTSDTDFVAIDPVDTAIMSIDIQNLDISALAPGTEFSLAASVTSDTSFTFEEQYISGTSYRGSGSVHGNIMTINFYKNDGSGETLCTGTYYKPTR